MGIVKPNRMIIAVSLRQPLFHWWRCSLLRYRLNQGIGAVTVLGKVHD